MLTADLVRARRSGGELVLIQLRGTGRARALELAAALVVVTGRQVGRTRRERDLAVAAVPFSAADKKLRDGLLKLLDDACSFAVETEVDPVSLRSEVFLAASVARSALERGQRLDRSAILAVAGANHGIDAERADSALFSDLRSAHVCTAVGEFTAEGLISRYETSQAQAVLLRAVSVEITVRCANADAYRRLFRQIKFRQLLHSIHPEPAGAYRIVVDGPFSLFESVTKYGLRLALLLPTLQMCEHWSLVAEVLWGREREKRRFRLEGSAPTVAPVKSEPAPQARLPDELTTLVRHLNRRGGDWIARPAGAILDLPGSGLCVPDLGVTHRLTGDRVWIELMGYWSRDAVWQRVELVQKGLAEPILFIVNQRLRVSEAVLNETDLGALYVFRTRPSGEQVERRVELLRQRARAGRMPAIQVLDERPEVDKRDR